MLKKTLLSTRSLLAQEQINYPLWYPVLLGIGIICAESYIVLVILFIIVAIFRTKTILIATSLIIVGMLAMQVRIATCNGQSIDYPFYVHQGIATIQEINQQSRYSQIILKNLQHNKLVNLSKIRLTIYNLPENIQAGDIVSFSAKLKPLPKQASPYAYNFARLAYFDEIGAIGFLTRITLHTKKHNFFEKIDILRNYIKNEFINIMGPVNGNIAAAFIVGKKGGIDNKIIENIRRSGLAHLLAISGLHLTIISFFFFAAFRKLLCLSIFLATKYNIKKWSAVASILSSTIYLVISGMPISAQRAFIMVLFVLIAILLDRNSSTMRSVSIAAIIILLIAPESILKPSFQMSFAAVIGLCAFYENRKMSYIHNIFYRVWRYFSSILSSSLVASLATAPYTIYHFNYFSLGGIISNLFAIPVATIIILPCGIISSILIPLGIANIPGFVMSKGIDIIICISNYIASWQYSSIVIGTLSDTAILFLTFGLLWLCLCQKKWRTFGIPIILLGMTIGVNYQGPDVWINDKMAAVKGEDGKLYFLSKHRKNFVNSGWIAQNAQKKMYLYKEHDNSSKVSIICDKDSCQYKNGKISVLFLYAPITFNSSTFDYVVQMKNFKPAQTANYISYNQIKNGYFIWLKNNKVWHPE